MLPEFPEIALTQLPLFPASYTQPHQGRLTPETPVKYSLRHLEKPGPTQPTAVSGSQPWSNVPMLPFVRWVPGLNVPLKVYVAPPWNVPTTPASRSPDPPGPSPPTL